MESLYFSQKLIKGEAPIASKKKGSEVLGYIYVNRVNENKVTEMNIYDEPEDVIFQPLPYNLYSKEVQRTSVYISGPSGAGKSTYAANFVNEIKKIPKYKKHDIFLITGAGPDSSDPAFDSAFKEYSQLNIYSSEFYALKFKDFKDSIVIFDDITAIEEKSIQQFIEKLQKALLENSRKLNVILININHASLDYMKTKYLIGESDTYVLFPSKAFIESVRFLESKCGIKSKQMIDRIENMPTRHVTIRKEKPRCLISDREIILLSGIYK